MLNTLDLLLKSNIKEFAIPTKEIKIKRLSEKLNNDVVFKVKALGLDKIKELRETNSGDFNIHTIIEGVIEPSFKDKNLIEKFGAITPVDLIKKLLVPGEIDDVFYEISKLSGYNGSTIEDIKKK
ncbi:MAG: hypothetical protein KH415_09675 [Clostridium sp.]|nr:hypothetical protein [Clostridium sp.]